MNIDQTAFSNIGRLSALPAGGSSISKNISQVVGNSDSKLSTSTPAQDSYSAMAMGTLGEINTPAPMVEEAVSSGGETAVLASESGSGGLHVKMAASIYVLNHSFDEQKGVLELIA
jgi:hypothetical protein